MASLTVNELFLFVSLLVLSSCYSTSSVSIRKANHEGILPSYVPQLSQLIAVLTNLREALIGLGNDARNHRENGLSNAGILLLLEMLFLCNHLGTSFSINLLSMLEFYYFPFLYSLTETFLS